MDDSARGIAGALLEIGAVALSPDAPYTWASGLRAPIYCDNRLTMAYPDVRRRITRGFETAIARLGWRPDVIAGTATAGIPHAAWLSDAMERPLIYVRANPKAHGRQNQIEGLLARGQRVVVIEDLISTGGSSLAVVRVLQDAGARVEGVLGIFSYGFPEAQQRFDEAGVPVHTLTTFPTLMDVAVERGALADDATATLAAWSRDPHAWSDAWTR